MSQDLERRIIVADEVKFEQGDKAARISGYAAVFNSPSQDLGGFREVIVPGAFTRALGDGNGNVPLLIEHDGLPLADTATGTLRLHEDDRGLAFAAELDTTDPDVQRVIPKLIRRTLRSMSFGFKVGEQRWDRASQGGITRFVAGVKKLFDVSIVTSPAYLDSSVALRSLETWAKEHPDEAAAPLRELRRHQLRLAAVRHGS